MYDSGSNCYIIHDLSDLSNYKPYATSQPIAWSDDGGQIMGIREINITVFNTYNYPRIVLVSNVRYIPKFHVIIISSAVLKAKRVMWNQHTNMIEHTGTQARFAASSTLLSTTL